MMTEPSPPPPAQTPRSEPSDPTEPIDAIGRTSLWVAAMRAVETERSEAEGQLCEDPFARALAGPEGFAVLEAADAQRGFPGPPVIALRTQFNDQRFVATLGRGVRQVVTLAAGMDARAFRLPFPDGVRLFEVDRKEVLAYKAARLVRARPRCQRTTVALDLRDDWPAQLVAAGVEPTRPTLWLVEGLLMYLDPAAVELLFERLSGLAAPGSTLLFDVLGRSFMESPAMARQLEIVRKMNAPWKFGLDEPEAFAARFGWRATATDPGELGMPIGRWPFPLPPRHVPGVPRSFFVEAHRP